MAIFNRCTYINKELKIKQQIEKEINIQINTYKANQNRIVSDYRNEQKTFKEYNGRQVLELLQNADDEESSEVLIKLDTKKQVLEISNKGQNCKAFSLGGIQSLMLSDYSPKKRDTNRKTYIGNKGLGFRSIVNWSEQITILTNNLQVDFSYKISQEVYKKYMNNDISKIAFLSLPKVEHKPSSHWTTSIIIKYKDKFLNDIQKQLDDIKDEVLLFVNHLEKLTIEIDNNKKIIERIKENNQIYLNNTMWTIFEYAGDTLLPKEDENEEIEHFDLKIAVKDEFNVDEKYLLYSFFPTEININFPFIIHGTFELDSSRNNININEKNKYILEKLVDFIVETAKKLTQNSINYQALEFLTHNSSNQRLKNLEFYDKIDKKINKLAIFPCLDNTYKTKDEVVFISDDFSDFIEKNNFQNFFSNMLISSKNSFIDLDDYYISDEINLSLIDKVSRKIDNIDARVEFVYLINIFFSNKDYSFEILIDENEEVILKTEEIYTPKFENMNNLVLPSFLEGKIKFLHKIFGQKLLEKFKIKDKKSYRELANKVSDIVNIKEYETATILERIIAETKKINTFEAVKEMTEILYKNFKIKEIQIETKQIPCISKTKEIKNAKDLFLSKSYPSGKLTEFLFEDIFEDNQFLISKDYFDFQENELEEVERFFEWLGVNKYTKFEKVSYSWHDNYDKYLFEITKQPDNYSKLSFEMQKIAYLEQIKDINIEKFIIWCLKDNNIQAELSKNYQVKYIKSGGYVEHYLTGNAPSYILYQLYKTNIFKDYLITNEKLGKLVNNFNIDFENEEFKRHNIKKADIQSLILKLGAVEKFEEMSIERIRQILNALEVKSPDGKQTQTIYKAVRNHQHSLNDKSIKLCAKKNNQLDYYNNNQNKVYYVNTTKLPKRILNNIPIINIPPRLGKVIEFFGIEDVKDIEIKIMQYQENKNLTKQFNDFFMQIRPFILVYRFESLKDIQTKESQLNNLKKSKIFLCDKVVYDMNEVEYTLENNDYIKSKNEEYFIKINNEHFDDIRRTLDFRETFADIIGSIFNIANIKGYDRLISDKVVESEEIIKREHGHEALQEAREYLNIADEFFTFWRTIYKLQGKTFNDKYKVENISNIKQELKLTTSIDTLDYKNINSIDNCKILQKLFEELNISIENFNKEVLYMKIDFTKFHQKNLEDCFYDNNPTFEKVLYQWCLSNNKKSVFIDFKGKYENADKEAKNILSIDYQNVVEQFVRDNFGFSLEDKQTTISFNKIYDEHLLKFEIEELTNSEKSLLYFKDGFQQLNTILQEREKQEKDKQHQAEDKKDYASPKQDNNSSIESRQAPKINKYNGYGSAHNPKEDKQKKEKGNKAEQCVFNKLVEDYGENNVKWISKESDNKHYDIRYKNKTNEWIYVEVKIFSNNMFYITKDEKKLADEEKESYEIFLLELSKDKRCENSCIRKIIKYSELEKLEFIPNKYEVYYTIKAQQNIGTQ